MHKPEILKEIRQALLTTLYAIKAYDQLQKKMSIQGFCIHAAEKLLDWQIKGQEFR